jgi:hypothetical protein
VENVKRFLLSLRTTLISTLLVGWVGVCCVCEVREFECEVLLCAS